ncbi:uncharacterized protein LOC124357156 [Homalodisca vitripennis]|uniref:uncharacterized protein LOC124357156 n=1 Tax=Homalodisca vitripennis TaxID=197043 RepID=UPI001EEBDF8B|nr:uncharacterized protein LOC124357156 [Homalodisca vitripennis]
MVMMIPTNITARSKRETSRSNSHMDSLPNWSDTQITDLVHNHVSSYWSERSNHVKSSKTLHNYKYTSKLQTQLEPDINQYKIKSHIENKHKISTKLDMINKTKDRTKVKLNKFDIDSKNDIVGFNKTLYLNSAKESVISTLASHWLGTLNSVYQRSRAYIENTLCCHMILCQLEKSKMKNTVKSSIVANLISHTLHWICSESSADMCNYSSQCQTPLARSITKTIVEFLRKF